MTHPVALLTGSGKRRLGSAIAEALARKGYRLAIHYRSSKEEAEETAQTLREYSPGVETFQADLADESQVTHMMRQVLARFQRIDVLVNCAAIWNRKKLEEVTAQDVREHFEINTLGTFLCSQQAGLQMVKQPEGGVIINFGDWAEVRPYLDYAAYFPSKGAVSTLTRCLAVELGHRNPRVRVNAILPGPVMLPADMSEAEKKAVIEATLVKRQGTPENVAQAVMMLVENDFLTGVLLPVDGGRTVYAGE